MYSNTSSSNLHTLKATTPWDGGKIQNCTAVLTPNSKTVPPVPMPHQLVLCQGTTYCPSGNNYLLISLYSFDSYISAAQTLDLYDWGSEDTNMHSYSQGKYIESMFSENKTGQKSGDSKIQQATQAVASYAIQKVEQDACLAVQTEAAGVPVCKVIKFIASFSSFFDDLMDNAPSGQSGEIISTFPHEGLGGNIYEALVQF